MIENNLNYLFILPVLFLNDALSAKYKIKAFAKWTNKLLAAYFVPLRSINIRNRRKDYKSLNNLSVIKRIGISTF